MTEPLKLYREFVLAVVALAKWTKGQNSYWLVVHFLHFVFNEHSEANTAELEKQPLFLSGRAQRFPDYWDRDAATARKDETFWRKLHDCFNSCFDFSNRFLEASFFRKRFEWVQHASRARHSWRNRGFWSIFKSTWKLVQGFSYI